MSTSIQELTEKIYIDGVAKANSEAEKILKNAQEEAAKIIADANLKAQQVLNQAKADAILEKKNTQAELQLYTKQTVAALQTEITNLLTTKIAANSIQTATADKDFMPKVILELVKSWNTEGKLEIKTSNAEKLNQYFEANAKDLLNNKVQIEQVNGIKTKFEIQPQGEAYKLVFGEEELIAYFKEFLRPQLIKTLFA